MYCKPAIRREGFTLIEIMIVVAIIALLAAIAVPSALRARKRSQATSSLEACRIIDAGIDQWAIETGQSPGASPQPSDLQKYVKANTVLYNQIGNGYANDAIGTQLWVGWVDQPTLIDPGTEDALSDVADSTFWGSANNTLSVTGS